MGGRYSIALTTIAGTVAEEPGSDSGFAWLRFGNVRVFSCYWTPNDDSAADRLEAFNGFLDGLDQAIRQGERGDETLLVAGDFNAMSTYWGSSVDDSKGEALEAFAASLRLWTNNVGSHPTYNLNHGNECPPITTAEVKATGLDGIPNEMLSLIANRSPDIFFKLYHRCLSESVFPVRWKMPVFYFFIKDRTSQYLIHLAFGLPEC